MNQKTIEVSLTLDELQAVIKSLSIGCDQLVKKMKRLKGTEKGEVMTSISKDYSLLLEAKQECETVFALALEGGGH